MSVENIADGVEGSKGPVTLSANDFGELCHLAGKGYVFETVKDLGNGGVEINAQELCRICHGDLEEVSPRKDKAKRQRKGLTGGTGPSSDESEE